MTATLTRDHRNNWDVVIYDASGKPIIGYRVHGFTWTALQSVAHAIMPRPLAASAIRD